MPIFNLVYEPPKWEPWTNTIAYYPLTSQTTVNDMSGNGYNLTQVWGSFWTYAWVDCFSSPSGNNYMKGNIGDITQYSHTISIWAYKTGYNGDANVYQWGRWSDAYKGGTEWLQWPSYIRNFYWYDDLDSASTYWTQERHNIITEFDKPNSKQIMYIDWVKIGERVTTYTHGPLYYTNDFYFLGWLADGASYSSAKKMYWYISNFIVENKVRTAQEIAGYYDQTKSNYWL